MLIIPTESSAAVVDKLRTLFGDKAIVADVPEKAVEIEKDTLKDLQSKHDVKVDKTNHPMPEPTASSISIRANMCWRHRPGMRPLFA